MAQTVQAAPAEHLLTIRWTVTILYHPSQMNTLGHSMRALALGLSLTLAGALCVVGAAAGAHATAGALVGGPQLGAPGVIVNLGRGVPAPPAMPGASFLIADMDTGQILAARAPHARHLPASTLKTLTALALIPLLDAKAKIMVQPQDVGVQGTRLGFVAGTAYTVGTLLQGLLMASGNDAAYALARANHSAAVTLTQMNALAADLGAFDTVAKDPAGLDQAGETSSAYDLALIGRAAMKLPDFRGYVRTRQASFPGGRSADGKLEPSFQIGNHNNLLYNYPGAIGIKTGYTVAAKYTYVEAATRGAKTYIVTEMSSPNSSWRPGAALLDWAFAHGTSLTPIGDLVEPGNRARSQTSAAPGNRPQSPASAAAHASPQASPHSSWPAPWVGVAAVLGALTLVGGWARGYVSRRRS
jgi:D-alanyl-D-alanine carboxypeptidase (penicillin-binding protein 5/6)